MTRLMTIEPNESGVVRVFLLARPSDMPRGQEIPVDRIAEWLRVGALNAADIQ